MTLNIILSVGRWPCTSCVPKKKEKKKKKKRNTVALTYLNAAAKSQEKSWHASRLDSAENKT